MILKPGKLYVSSLTSTRKGLWVFIDFKFITRLDDSGFECSETIYKFLNPDGKVINVASSNVHFFKELIE